MILNLKILVLILAVLFSNSLWSAIPANVLVMNGAVSGGKAGGKFSLLDVRSSITKGGKIERLVLDIGDGSMQKLKGRIGYYNLELKNGRQLVLDLSETIGAKFNEKTLKEKLKKSHFINESQIFIDPNTQNLSLVLNLKRVARVKAVSVRGLKETGKLIIDLYEDNKK